MFVLYTDDSLLAGPDKHKIDKLTITMEGNLADVLGGNIERKSNGTIRLTQPYLIDQILEDFCIKRDGIKPSSTLASLMKLFSRHLE